jgi:hypothetical protein
MKIFPARANLKKIKYSKKILLFLKSLKLKKNKFICLLKEFICRKNINFQNELNLFNRRQHGQHPKRPENFRLK